MRGSASEHCSWLVPLVLLLGLTLGTACVEAPTEMAAPAASLQMHAITPATVRSLLIEVSGPGIDPAQLVNIPVDSAGVANGTIETTAGSGRRIVVTAVDTTGTSTHRGDTTVTLVPGLNPPLALVLRPMGASLGITVTFGDALAMRSRNDVTTQ